MTTNHETDQMTPDQRALMHQLVTASMPEPITPEPGQRMTILLIDPDGTARIALPETGVVAELAAVQQAVGGSLAELSYGDEWTAYGNSDGIALGLDPNPVAASFIAESLDPVCSPNGPVLGTVAFLGSVDGEWRSTPVWLLELAPELVNAVLADGRLLVALDSGEAVHHSTIFRGESFSPAELDAAQALARKCMLPRSTTAAQAALFLRWARETEPATAS